MNQFPVQKLAVLLRENAKKSKQHYGQEAKLGVIHPATSWAAAEHPQQAQYWFLVLKSKAAQPKAVALGLDKNQHFKC